MRPFLLPLRLPSISLLLILIFSLACNLPGFLLPPQSDSPEPQPATPTATSALLFLPTLAPTATPYPTVLPATSIASGERALSNGDWEQALQEFRRAAAAAEDPDLQAAALLGGR